MSTPSNTTASRECRDGKHWNCDGDALDPHSDEIVTCECACHRASVGA